MPSIALLQSRAGYVMQNKRHHFFCTEKGPVVAEFRPETAATVMSIHAGVRASLFYLLIFFTAAFSPVFSSPPLSVSEAIPAGMVLYEDSPGLSYATAAPGAYGLLTKWRSQFMLSRDGLRHLTILNKPPLFKPFWGNIANGHVYTAMQYKSLNPTRLLIHNFLRVSSGEWVPLCRPFSGKRRDLGVTRSFLYFRGDLEQMRLRSA